MECRAVRDLLSGPALLALARDVLLKELMPLLPPAAHFEARLVANSMAIAEREAISGAAPAQGILRELEELYGEGGEGEGEERLLRRFARDLRAGMFEDGKPRERRAREILWRLTIAKLLEANPRFL